MAEIDAVGDAIAGGLIGRAVEPRAGEGDGHTHEANCLNCNAVLEGPFCKECGQHAHVHRTLGAFFHDFLHGVLHFEGKIWRTLPLLVWRPGELTRRYVDGQRPSFVSPIALFLFFVFLMFGALSATGNINPHIGSRSDLKDAENATTAKIAKLEKKRASPNLDAGDVKDIDEDIQSEKEDLALIRDLRQRGVTSAVFDREQAGGKGQQWSAASEVPFLKEAFAKAKENPELLLYKLKSNSYKWSWAVIPLSVPFLWLLFPFSRRFRAYDHTIFITYSVAFMMLLMTTAVLLSAAGFSGYAAALLLIPPVHMYRQLRGAYGVGRFGAIWRTFLLAIFANLVLTAFIVLMATLGVLD